MFSGKITSEDDEIPSMSGTSPSVNEQTTQQATSPPKTTTTESTTEKKEEPITTTIPSAQEVIEPAEPTESLKPQPRLLNLNVDDLQSFANALHNQTDEKEQKKVTDLSDVNLDDDEEEPPRMVVDVHKHNKDITDKFYSNLQAPFHPLMNVDRGSEEYDTCKENDIVYKVSKFMACFITSIKLSESVDSLIASSLAIDFQK